MYAESQSQMREKYDYFGVHSARNILCNVSSAKINKEESSALDIKNTYIFTISFNQHLFELTTPSFSNGQGYTYPYVHAHSQSSDWTDALISAENYKHRYTCMTFMYRHASDTCIQKFAKELSFPTQSLTHTHTQAGCQAFRRRRREWVQRVSSTIISYTVLPHRAVCVCVCFYSDRIWVCASYQTCFNRLYVIICLSQEFICWHKCVTLQYIFFLLSV